MLKRIIFSAVYFLAVSSLDSVAGISVSQSIVHFEEGGKRSEDISVVNQGQETVYIRIEPSVITNPGMENEGREIYRDPRAAGLLVTPQRLVIPAGGRKRLRIVRLDNSEQSAVDKVFRILVKPEVGDVTAEQTAVKIIVAYEILVLSQPKMAKIKLVHEFKDGNLFISNRGNTNVLLQKGHQCPKGQSIEDEVHQCAELAGKRIYAGNQWSVAVPNLEPVTYQISVGTDNQVYTFESNINKK